MSYHFLILRVISVNRVTGKTISSYLWPATKGIWEDIGKLKISSFSGQLRDIGEQQKLWDKCCSWECTSIEVLRYGTIDDVIESVRLHKKQETV